MADSSSRNILPNGHCANLLISALLAYALAGFFSGGLELLGAGGLRLISGWSWKAAGIAALLLWAGARRKERIEILPAVLALGLFLLLLGDFPSRKFVFYCDGVTRNVIFALGIVLTFAYFSGRERFLSALLSWPALLVAQALITVGFLRYAHGQLIFSDDHPSFLYRLNLLREHFPQIPFYNPDWNAGYSGREFFATGALNVFALVSPFLYLGPSLRDPGNAHYYTLIVPYLFVFIVPWSVVLAARLLDFSREGSIAAGVFALGPTLGLFEWLLQFGTIGFTLSAGLAPIAWVLMLRLITREVITWPEALGAPVAFSLCVAWPVSGLVFVPLLCFGLLSVRRVFAPAKRAKVFAAIAFALAVNLTWLVLFLRYFDLAAFSASSRLPGSSADGVHGTAALSAKGVPFLWQEFRELVAKLNPAIFFLSIPGFFALKRSDERIPFAATLLFLVFIAAFGECLRPQFELRRLVIPAAYLLAVLSGEGLLAAIRSSSAWFEKGWSGKTAGTCASLTVLGAFIASPLSVSAIYTNHSDHKYLFATRSVYRLSEAIAQNGGEGRIFFLGFLLHELGAPSEAPTLGGHAAPLATWTGKPLYASHFYHARWSSVDPIPKAYRDRGEAGIEEFLDLVNATAVVTFRREWAEYRLSRSRYREVFHEGRFRLFTRTSERAGYFLRGSGEILRAAHDRLVVVPHEEEVVIKFRYLPNLRVSAGAELLQEPAFLEDAGGGKVEQVSFVKLRVPADAVAKRQQFVIGYSPR